MQLHEDDFIKSEQRVYRDEGNLQGNMIIECGAWEIIHNADSSLTKHVKLMVYINDPRVNIMIKFPIVIKTCYFETFSSVP